VSGLSGEHVAAETRSSMIERIETTKPALKEWLGQSWTLTLPRWAFALAGLAGVVLLLVALD
jgi:hypothetical protein